MTDEPLRLMDNLMAAHTGRALKVPLTVATERRLLAAADRWNREVIPELRLDPLDDCHVAELLVFHCMAGLERDESRAGLWADAGGNLRVVPPVEPVGRWRRAWRAWRGEAA